MMQVLILGCGFVGKAFGLKLLENGAQVIGTSRTEAGTKALTQLGLEALVYDSTPSDALAAAAEHADIILQSIPPNDAGDPAFKVLLPTLSQATSRKWIGYLSTTGVYGDRDGGWAFEDDTPTPVSLEAKRRVAAEAQWLNLASPAHVFRLPGIYGPGRSALEQVLSGKARRIDRPGQIFSRAHVDDIVSALLASIHNPNYGRIYNICDDLPCPSGDVIVEACRLLNRPAPPLIPFEQAELSEMGKRFYLECKRVSNARAKSELRWRPAFPTYFEGLADCLLAL